MSKPKIIVFGYHDVGYECLNRLIEKNANIVAVFTHENNPDEIIWFKSVADLAKKYQIPTFTPNDPNETSIIEKIQSLQPDIIFSFYYRHMISQPILDIPRLGAFNMHGSLLPKYRGRVPINWAIIHGEKQSGVTLHHMVKLPDAGDIVDQQAVEIGPDETAQDIFLKVTKAAGEVLMRQFDAIAQGTAPRRPQDESKATYFSGRRPEDGRIQWQQSANQIHNLIRAVTRPYPGAFTDIEGQRLFIWRVKPYEESTQANAGEILSTQPLRIATGSGYLEILDKEWQSDTLTPPVLTKGQVL
jgi:methionyl-tRNA formyltransferase